MTNAKFDTDAMRVQLKEMLDKSAGEELRTLAGPICDAMIAVVEGYVAGMDQAMKDSLLFVETAAEGGNLQNLLEKFKAKSE